MADGRLAGLRLRAARALVERPFTRRGVWKAVSHDFGVGLLRGLPESDLGDVEMVPMPVRGAPPRRWEDQALPPPSGPRTTGAALRRAYAEGRRTPVEVLDRLLEAVRQGEFGEATHSPFVTLDPEVAREAARASARRWADGAPLGPLDGVPVPIKDHYQIRGLPAWGGTRWRGRRFHEDAVMVARLRAGGALVVGTTHATENGLNPLGFNPHHAMPRNVYSAAHGAGGSSTGAGVVVGLGLSTVASGSDGGGSIRIPAAHNGVFGLKPTFNRLSSTGNLWKTSVAHGGPLGASVEDLVDFLEVAAGPDAADPYTRFADDWETVRPTWRAALGRGVRGCRIGVLRGELADADPAIASQVEAALSALEAEGAVLVDVALDRVEVVNAIGSILIASESAAAAASDMAAHRRDSGDELRLLYGLIESVDAQLYLHARRARAGLRRRVAALLSGVDVLALPTTQRLAAPHPPDGVQRADLGWTRSMTRFSFLGNLTGLPAMSVPVGRVDGLPVGLQILGDAFDEASVIAVGAHAERVGLSALPAPRGAVDLLG